MQGNHVNIGKHGENLAKDYLNCHGYQILESNYRYNRFDIDIITRKANEIQFIEVKTRKSNARGNPEDHVNSNKMDNIREVAEFYLESRSWKGDIRFDIISILLNKTIEIKHFKDAF